PPTLHELYDL
nr:Chain B, Early E1A 32 kDa protein [Human adenovirus 5]2R7G_D Chain D, Early E1A 32 kDa protein [Human adenovirus 5]2R7G_E Chain E, Early E1A 32 kDa protein [Human adenovirus 5]